MRWLREHGVIGNYDDYVGLPVLVIEDARQVMAAEWQHEAAEAVRNREQRRRAERGQRR
ncbi:MAG: hypothetical protein AB7I38_10950 [Dehalococcoidia bacterium]